MLRFVREFGEFVAQIDKTAFPTVHKFEIAAADFDVPLRDMSGEQFLDPTEGVDERDATDRVSVNR